MIPAPTALDEWFAGMEARLAAAGSPHPATRRQQDALRFIAGHIEAKGCAPSLDEIGGGLVLNSRSSVLRLVRGLEERGHLRRLPNRARAIEPTHPVTIPRGPTGEPLYFVEVR